jgi:lysyl-tRNA synthetase class II
MPDDATNAATGGSPGKGGMPDQATPAQQAQQQTATDGTSGQGGTPSQPDQYAELRESIRKERELREAAEKRLKAIEEKDLPEAERAARRLAEMEQSNADLVSQLQQERTRSRVVSAAQRLGFADPEDAMSLIDTGDLEIVDGYPKNTDKVLKDLLAKKPYLASSTARATGSAEGGVRGGGRTTDMNQLLRQAAGRT